MSTNKLIEVDMSGMDAFNKRMSKLIKSNMMHKMQNAVNNSAEELAFVAREMSPERSGALESAIRPVVRRNSEGMVVWAGVDVDPNVYADEYDKYVGEYADEAHEKITPSGKWKLGKRSRVKDATSRYKKYGGVGGGFLDRAIEAVKPNFEADMADSVSEVLKKRK